MKDNRVLLGFSGGIDSFAAVGLLQAAGYHVTALTLDMRGDSALLEKARLRAGALGIPWRMRSVRERFEREVVDYRFCQAYSSGFGCSSSKNSGFSRLMNPITSSKPSRNLEKSSL